MSFVLHLGGCKWYILFSGQTCRIWMCSGQGSNWTSSCWHMTARATKDISCDRLHNISGQYQILNTMSKVRDQNWNCMNPSWSSFSYTSIGMPQKTFFCSLFFFFTWWVEFHGVYVQHFLNPFTYQWVISCCPWLAIVNSVAKSKECIYIHQKTCVHRVGWLGHRIILSTDS